MTHEVNPSTKLAARKTVAIYLSMKPEGGGKYQYSLSILDGLAQLDKRRYEVIAVLVNGFDHSLVPHGIRVVTIKRQAPRTVSFLKRRILRTNVGLAIWRFIGRFLDPVQSTLHHMHPNLVLFPGNDAVSYESSLPFLIPIFDLMHRYERAFPEVGERTVYASREFHYSRICKYGKGVLVDSDLGKKHVLQCYTISDQKIFVLPYTPPSYVYSSSTKVDVFSKYALPERFLFYPAQFWEHKNHKGLLTAIEILKRNGIIINVIFVGAKKNSYERVMAQVKRSCLDSQVFHLGYVTNDEIVELYRHAVALVFPTFFGPTNIPPLEAFALGCPVITSNVYDTFTQVGDAALLFDPTDPLDIARQIEAVWTKDQLREELKQRGRMRSRLFSQLSFNRNLCDIIELIARG